MEKTLETVRELLGSQYFAVLNSFGQGQPYSSLVSFAVSVDLKSLVFVTSRNTRKFSNMRENTRVALLIDNRSNLPADVSGALAVTALGDVSEVAGDREALRSLFVGRHPYLKEFTEAENSALMVVRVNEYIVAGFAETRRLVIER